VLVEVKFMKKNMMAKHIIKSAKKAASDLTPKIATKS